MCGIAGLITRGRIGDVEPRLEEMTRQLAHRGPDGRGQVWEQSNGWNVGLAHTRLAILDLSEAGRQPMAGSRRPLRLTYNGEIYNFRELRRELEAEGYQFRSRTDTEVLLSALEAQGTRAIQRLRGMFSFGVWDGAAKQLVLARDPLGIKPLYYYHADGLLAFASEVRALLASGLVARRLDPNGVASYLRYGSTQAPATIIRGVECVPPGHYVVVEPLDRGLRVTHVEYAKELLSDPASDAVTDRQDAIAALRRLLEEAVSLHLVSDVPLGVFLSGGIDSAALVALASRVAEGRVKSFCVAFAEREFTEAAQARLLADRFGADHREIHVSEATLRDALPDALGALDQPSTDGINTFVISRAVKAAGITVALSGLGGDELFAGYPSFRRARRLEIMARLPRGVRRAASVVGRAVLHGSVRQRKLWELLASDGSPHTAYRLSRQVFGVDEVCSLLSRDVRGVGTLQDLDWRDPINAVSVCELRGYTANTLLRDTDCMSMAHALEVRVPFLDSAVVRYVLRVPGKWKTDGRRPKPLLLEALGGLLPEEIWRRPKMGFTLPLERWMQSALKPELDATLSSRSGLSGVGINPEVGRGVWTAFVQHPRRERWLRPWALFVLARWCELNDVRL